MYDVWPKLKKTKPYKLEGQQQCAGHRIAYTFRSSPAASRKSSRTFYGDPQPLIPSKARGTEANVLKRMGLASLAI